MPRPSRRKTSRLKNLGIRKTSPVQEPVDSIPVEDVKSEQENQQPLIKIEPIDNDDIANLHQSSLINDETSDTLSRVLQEGYKNWELQREKNHRPSRYHKVSLTSQKPLRTQREHKAIARKNEENLRKQGFMDIRSFLQPSTSRNGDSFNESPVPGRSSSSTDPTPSSTQDSHSLEPSMGGTHPNGGTRSLRAELLSPTVLARPKTQHLTSTSQPEPSIAMRPLTFVFDPRSSFHAALTPSTVLTPPIGVPVAFPPSSPNIAASYTMANSLATGSAAAAPITPNTLHATSGAFQPHAGVSQVQQQSNGNTVGGGSSSGQSHWMMQTSVASAQMPAPASTSWNSLLAPSQTRQTQQPSMYQPYQAHLYDTNSNSNSHGGPQNMAQSNGAAGNGSVVQNQAQMATTTSLLNNAKREGDCWGVAPNISAKTSAPKKSKLSASDHSAATCHGRSMTSLSNAEGDIDMGIYESEESDDDGDGADAEGDMDMGIYESEESDDDGDGSNSGG